MRWALLFVLLGCRRPNEPPSTLVVTPSAVDGGALVTAGGQPVDDDAPPGCPSPESVSADANRLAAALHERFGVGWKTTIDDGRIFATPTVDLEEGRDTAVRVFETVQATFPDLLLGVADVSGHRMSVFTCRGQLVKPGVDVRTRHAVCLETKGLAVEEVRVDRSRRLPAFARLFVVHEEEAMVVALDHVHATQDVDAPVPGRPQLLLECDDRGRASALRWVVDVTVGWGIVTVTLDARTRRIIETKVHRL